VFGNSMLFTDLLDKPLKVLADLLRAQEPGLF
jgi:hypothetical protein